MNAEGYREWLDTISRWRERVGLDWATHQYLELIDRAQRDGFPEFAAEATQMQGIILLNKKDYEGALNLYQQAADLAAKYQGEKFSVLHGQILRDIGNVLGKLGRFTEAGGALEESYEILCKSWDKNGAAMAVVFQAKLLAAEGNYREAECKLKEGIKLLDEHGNRYFRASARMFLARLKYRDGSFCYAAGLAWLNFFRLIRLGHWQKAKDEFGFVVRTLVGPLGHNENFKP